MNLNSPAAVAMAGFASWMPMPFGSFREWDAEQSELNCATFSPNGKWIATAGDDGSIRVWEANTGLPLARFIAHDDHALRSSSSVMTRW